MTDSYIQVPTDSTGKKVETTQLDLPDGTALQRERVDIPEMGFGVTDYLRMILIELRVQSTLQASAFELTVDLDHLRGSLGDKV